MLRLLPLLLLASLVVAQPATAATKAKCPSTTIVIGTKNKPRACVPKQPQAPSPQDLKPLTKFGLKPPKGAKRNKRTEALTARLLGVRVKARAARRQEGEFGQVVRTDQAPDGSWTREYQRNDGIQIVERMTQENGGVIETRDKSGAGHTMGMQGKDVVAQCPAANGDVPAKFDHTLTFGEAVSTHGKRTWTLVSVRIEADWKGHVGVGAKAETFDFALRGELTIKSGVEIASTGKVLKRMPTRTYRSALTKQGLPVSADPVALAKDFVLRGPKGKSGSNEDVKAATGLLTTSVMAIGDMKDALEKGDKRWYEARACATIDYTSSPEKVVKGGRGDWNVWVMAQDGTRAADARWSIASTCGALSATSLSGPTAQFGVVDEAGAWEPGTPGACATAEITSTAGRPRPFSHSIPPAEPKRYRYDIQIDFKKDMGSGIAQTNATGLGRVTVGPGEGYVDGEGQFFGTEWDSGIGNPCGHDMLRTRAFNSDPVVVGAEIKGDEVTIAFTAVDRLFDASWILTLPLTGGEEFYSSFEPFCGTPGKALRTSTVKVTGTPVS